MAGSEAESGPGDEPSEEGRVPSAPSAREEVPVWLRVACLVLIVAGLALPLINVGKTAFWVDESIAVLPAQSIHERGLPKNPFDLDFMPWQLKDNLWDPATPLYRYTVAAWTAVFGFSETTTRLLSILCGIGAALAFFKLVRLMRGPTLALLATTFFVISPTYMIFARESRHFTFVMLLAITTLYLLRRSVDRPGGWAAYWPVFGFGTLLAQTMGYFLLPVGGLWFLILGHVKRISWRHWPAYVAAAAAWGAVIWFFWETLPFFHPVDCANRFSGCQPNPAAYAIYLWDFLAPMKVLLGGASARSLSLWHLLFLLGLGLTVGGLFRADRRRDAMLVLIWFLVPFLVLSSRDVKFPRYLFMWAWPACAFFVAEGARRLATGKRGQLSGNYAAVGVVLVATAFSPTLRFDWATRPSLALVDYVNEELVGAREDNWEKIRYSARMVGKAKPEDVIVTSFDDAGLGYYAGRFVYGFLNSRRNDEFFLDLQRRTVERGGRVWYVDTLPQWNFCLTESADPKRIDCAEKYARFHNGCTGSLTDMDHECVRIPVR